MSFSGTFAQGLSTVPFGAFLYVLLFACFSSLAYLLHFCRLLNSMVLLAKLPFFFSYKRNNRERSKYIIRTRTYSVHPLLCLSSQYLADVTMVSPRRNNSSTLPLRSKAFGLSFICWKLNYSTYSSSGGAPQPVKIYKNAGAGLDKLQILKENKGKSGVYR